jgi:hypothetical protein
VQCTILYICSSSGKEWREEGAEKGIERIESKEGKVAEEKKIEYRVWRADAAVKRKVKESRERWKGAEKKRKE